MNKTFAKAAAVSITALILISGCSDPLQPGETQVTLTESPPSTTALDGLWEAGCIENPLDVNVPNSITGYKSESLLFNNDSATLTVKYYQDAACSIAVTSTQVANEDQNYFLQKQSKMMSLSFPAGRTSTEIGNAKFIDIEEDSISIDDVTLTTTQLQERDIELQSLVGIFVVTPSDRLHISVLSGTRRPTTVPLDYFYNRSLEETTD